MSKSWYQNNSLCCNVYFAQVCAFCMLINKNVLEWFLLIICKEYALTRSTKNLGRNLLTLCFGLRKKGWQMLNTEQFPHQTDKSSHDERCSMKKLFLNISQYFSTWKETATQMFSCCEMFKNIYVEEDLVTAASELTLEKDCLELYFWIIAFKTIQTQSICRITICILPINMDVPW